MELTQKVAHLVTRCRKGYGPEAKKQCDQKDAKKDDKDKKWVDVGAPSPDAMCCLTLL